VFKAALAGLPYDVPDYSVCVECKFNENVCMYDRGVTCLGPVTRAGCNAWCINNGNVCYGCRGLVSNPNRAGSDEVLRAHGLDARDIVNKMMMYNAAMELADE
jgi:coenzyme F420-reducing hydrogenase gamma subunit